MSHHSQFRIDQIAEFTPISCVRLHINANIANQKVEGKKHKSIFLKSQPEMPSSQFQVAQKP